MYRVRRWSARHARLLEAFYNGFEGLLVRLSPVFRRIGYERLDRPVAVLEKAVKGLLFDTRMCGSCTLGATGMVCPMNCPKSMRNGPCGGVRSDGHCEVKPDMPCVWVDAHAGSRLMKHGERMREFQAPVDHRLQDTSSWMREVRRKTGTPEVGNLSG